MWFFGFGIGFIIGAIIVWIFSQKTSRQIEQIKAIETSTIHDLQEISKTISQQIGSVGSFREQVEVKGVISSSNPLIAELSQRPCVYYKTQIIEEYKETYYDRDSEGNRQRKTRSGADTLADNLLQISFTLDDGTGLVRINPNDAQIEAIEVVNRYEVYQNQSRLSFGAVNLNISSHNTRDRRIIGYRYREWILPIDTQIYVLGEISDSEGQLTIHQPSEQKNPFLITYKSEEELLKAKQSLIKQQRIALFACCLIGIVLIIIGLLK